MWERGNLQGQDLGLSLPLYASSSVSTDKMPVQRRDSPSSTPYWLVRTVLPGISCLSIYTPGIKQRNFSTLRVAIVLLDLTEHPGSYNNGWGRWQ